MTVKDTEQIIPFPFPPHLSTFIGHKLDTNPVLGSDGSIVRPFNLSRRTPLGKLVLRSLKIAPGPSKKESATFFLKLSQFSTNKQDKLMQDCRSNYVRFSEDDIKNIEEVFQFVFESNLKQHVNGFINGVKDQNPKKQRGVIEKAIFDFCTLNSVVFTNKNLSAWKKMLQRQKITTNNFKINVL